MFSAKELNDDGHLLRAKIEADNQFKTSEMIEQTRAEHNISSTAMSARSFLSSSYRDGSTTAHNDSTIDLCQTCQSAFGVGETADKIKSIALGMSLVVTDSLCLD